MTVRNGEQSAAAYPASKAGRSSTKTGADRNDQTELDRGIENFIAEGNPNNWDLEELKDHRVESQSWGPFDTGVRHHRRIVQMVTR
jgi:hypothetical protein